MTCALPSGYTLVFSGYNIGTTAYSYNTKFARAVAIPVRQNFWSERVILDGRYPALVWTHDFMVYHEDLAPASFAKYFLELSELVTSDPYDLRILNQNTKEDIIVFGDCYLIEPTMEEPDELLLFGAGIFKIQFQGTVIPSVVTTP